ncbi:MAG TPA: hypothetical protein VIQ00_10340 [Chitinophagaceae bacterium]|jgi:hypothetical protein
MGWLQLKLLIDAAYGRQRFYQLVFVSIIKGVLEKNIFWSNKNAQKVMGVIQPETSLEKDDQLLLFGAPANLEFFIES